MKMRKLLAWLLATVWCSAIQAANVVVLDDSTFVEASLTDATITQRRVLMIPDKKRMDAANWVYVLDKSHKLKNFSAVFVDENGKVLRKFKKNDLQMTELSSSLADDSYTYYFEYTPVSYPVTVTYEWTIESHDGNISYPSFCPIDEYEEEVRHASYTIRCSADAPCRYKAVQCDVLKDKYTIKKQDDGSIKVVFNQLPAVKKEVYALPLYRQIPMVLFAPDHFSYLGTQGQLDTWKNFGRWQYGLLEGRDELPEVMKRKVHELTDALPTKREKIARLYQYLYDNTRYVSIQLGIGGYQPVKASEVVTNGFGDCKGLSNYMVSLLREIGIPAIYAAISTTHAQLLSDFPNLNQLNHAIVAVPMEKDTLWLECTNARIPLGYVHDDIAGHDAVLITSDGGKVVRLPHYADTANVQKSEIKMTVAATGRVQMNCHVRKVNLQYENLLPLLQMDTKEQQKVLLSNIFFPGAQVTKLSVEEEKGKAAVNTILEATSAGYANVTGKRIFAKVNPLKASYGNMSSDENRKNPVFIDFGYCDEEDILISLPDGYRIESMPIAKEITNQFATFKVTFKQENQSLHAHYRVVIHAGTYGANDFEEFVKTKNAIAQAYRQQIVLVSQ